jgi:SAM-dependent methyltransferase
MIKRASGEEQTKDVRAQMQFLSHFLTHETVFLEIGPGDCALSYEAAKYVKKVLAIDVSKEVANISKAPDNFQLILSDGSGIPLPSESIHVAYSHQLMEHLHPDDALEQLQNIYKVLVPGGLYICITPNRLNGPHDVSMHFERVALGFHLKEYTNTELVRLFKAVGFSKIKAYVQVKELCFRFPLFLIKGCEWLLSLLPYSLRKAIALTKFCRLLLGIRLIGQKSQSKIGS